MRELDELAAQAARMSLKPVALCPWPRNALGDADADRVADADEDDRYSPALALCRKRRAGSDRDQQPGAPLQQLLLDGVVRPGSDPNDVEDDIAILFKPDALQAAPKRVNQRAVIGIAERSRGE